MNIINTSEGRRADEELALINSGSKVNGDGKFCRISTDELVSVDI